MIDQKLERFSAGEQFAVNPDAIERELASLWRAAGQASAVGQPVTRACLWNVILHVEARPGEEGDTAADTLADVARELPKHLAARALVLRTEVAEAGSPDLESWISANCIPSGDGGKLVCSEEITLLSRGAGLRHLPSLVRALLVPSVPTAIVFGGVPDASDSAIEALVKVADRVVMQVDSSLRANPFERAKEVVATSRSGAMDLGWLSLSGVRAEIAALFDPPVTQEDLRAISHVEVAMPADSQWSGRLLLGWIAGSLGARGRPVRAAASGGGLRWRVDRPKARSLDLSLSVGERLCVTFWPKDGGDPRRVRTQSGARVEIETVDLTTEHRPLPRPGAAERVARALVTRAQDRSFSAALDFAAELS